MIRECFIQSGPVYIFFPLDLEDAQVPVSLLHTPIDLALPSDLHTQQTTNDAIEAVIEAITKARSPAIFVDCLVQRHNVVAELTRLADVLKFPIYTSNMGKGIIDENHANYVGVYNGTVSAPGVAEAFDDSDLVLCFGSLPCDTNTGGFSRQISPDRSVEIAPSKITVSTSGSSLA